MAIQAASENQDTGHDDAKFMEKIIAECNQCLNETGKADMSSRLLQVLPTVVRRLHELIREIDLTEPELMAACEFLTTIGKHNEIVLLSDVFGLSVHANQISFGDSTEGSPPNVEGPYYLAGAELKADGNIVGDDEPGVHLVLSGRVTDARTGKPLSGAVLDFWQTDDAAEYDIEGYHMRGYVKSDDGGQYRAHTIKPKGYEVGTAETPTAEFLDILGRYRKRPAHIHLKVFADGYRELTTQIFFEGDPLLQSDVIFAVKKGQVVDPAMDAAGKAGTVEFDVAMVPESN